MRPPLSTGALLQWSVVGIALLFSASLPVTTNDLHIYLSMGRWMVEHGRLLEEEVFTWTAAGAPFVNGTWGFSVAAFRLHSWLGLDGLRLFNGACVGLAVLGVMQAARARGADRRAAALAGLVAWILVLQNTVVRGQTWVFPLFAGLMWLAARPRPSWLAFLTGGLAGALWANLHGSFPAGLAYLGALAVGGWRDGHSRTPALLGLGLALGACANPYGLELWGYVLDNSALPRERDFVEWYPPDPGAFEGLRFYAVIGLWCVLLPLGRRRPLGHALVLLGFGALALGSTRFVAWFGLATAPALALRLSEGMGPDRGLPGLGKLAIPLGLAWLVFLAKLVQPLEQPLHQDTPEALVRPLEQAHGNILNPPEYGGYLNWVAPGLETSGDIRTWVFDDHAWDLYVLISRAPPDWEDQLRAQGVQHLLLLEAFHGETLLPAARASPCWRELASDERGASFSRTGAPGCAVP